MNNAFLNGDLADKVYMTHPEDFVSQKQPDVVCKLKKALYELKQVPRAWYEKLKAALIKWKIKNAVSDPSLFYKRNRNNLIILLVYVDDILITGSLSSEVRKAIENLKSNFALKELGSPSYFLGVEVKRDKLGMHLS